MYIVDSMESFSLGTCKSFGVHQQISGKEGGKMFATCAIMTTSQLEYTVSAFRLLAFLSYAVLCECSDTKCCNTVFDFVALSVCCLKCGSFLLWFVEAFFTKHVFQDQLPCMFLSALPYI